MAINSRVAAHDGKNPSVTSQARLFAVRLWTEVGTDGWEHRGSAKDVVTGAYRGFKDWSDLTEFMTGQLEEDERLYPEHAQGGKRWPLED